MQVNQQELLKKAESYFDEGKSDKAEPLLMSLINSKAEIPESYYMLGTIFYEKGKFKKAIACYKKALEINPCFTDGAIGLSVVLNDLGKYEEAQKVFIEAQNNIKKEKKLVGSKIDDRIALHHFDLCKLYQDNQQPDKAMDNLKAYEEIKGESEVTVKEKINIYHSTSNFAKVCDLLENFLSQKNRNQHPELELMLAENYYLNQKPLLAFNTCERILKFFPDYKKAEVFYNKLKQTKYSFQNTYTNPQEASQ